MPFKSYTTESKKRENEVMKLKQRMMLIILGSIFVILAGMLTYIGTSTKKMAEDSAFNLASVNGERIAGTVKNEMDMAMTASRTMAETLEAMKMSNVMDRKAVNAMLKRVLEDNPSFMGAWTLWEPNAFDGLDEKFANVEGQDPSGRMNTFWSRSNNTLITSWSEGYEEPGVGDYYLLPKTNSKETILNPYIYTIGNEDVLMTSLVVPIMIDNKFVGVTAVDMRLDSLETMMEKFKLYDTGFAAIYSNDSTIVTSPQKEQMGKKYKEFVQDSTADSTVNAFKAGTILELNSGGMYKRYTPINIGRTNTPWSVGVTIPLKEVTVESNQLLISIIAAGIVALILLGGVVFLITNAIVKPITASVAIGENMARGDFTIDVPKKYLQRKDEIGILAQVFQNITKSMRTMIGQVSLNSSQVAAASQQISASAEELASGSNSQAESAQTMNELFKELSSAINSVAKNAEQASELSNKTAGIAMDGGKVIQQSIEGMNQVNQQMSRLEEDSQKIGEIIEVIDDIAEQTNLLALNAAIEAARAGDQGRGFAVVADEVRKLAERSGEATKQITSIIKGMQENTRTSVKAVGEGVESSQKTGIAFESIITMVNESANKVTEIAAASEEQAAQSSEVQASIETISASTEEAAASSEQTASTAQSLAQLAEELNNTIANFKIK
jgi:methyl-accepting chemotaxis protein